MKKLSIQALDFDRSVCMALYAILVRHRLFRQSSSLLESKERAQNFRSISQEDGQAALAKSTQLVMLIIYIYIFIGSPTTPSGSYKRRGKLDIPCSGCNNNNFNRF